MDTRATTTSTPRTTLDRGRSGTVARVRHAQGGISSSIEAAGPQRSWAFRLVTVSASLSEDTSVAGPLFLSGLVLMISGPSVAIWGGKRLAPERHGGVPVGDDGGRTVQSTVARRSRVREAPVGMASLRSPCESRDFSRLGPGILPAAAFGWPVAPIGWNPADAKLLLQGRGHDGSCGDRRSQRRASTSRRRTRWPIARPSRARRPPSCARRAAPRSTVDPERPRARRTRPLAARTARH